MWGFFLGVLCTLGVLYLSAVEKRKKGFNRQAREFFLENVVNEGRSPGEISVIDFRDVLENEMALGYLGTRLDTHCHRNIQAIRLH